MVVSLKVAVRLKAVLRQLFGRSATNIRAVAVKSSQGQLGSRAEDPAWPILSWEQAESGDRLSKLNGPVL